MPMPGILVVHRDRAIVFVALLIVTLLAAFYTIAGVGMNMSAIEMTAMARAIGRPMAMPTSSDTTVIWFLVMFFMWWVMMVAMMLPSAAPTVFLFAALKRSTRARGVAGLTMYFLAGYLFAWAVFSGIAVVVQWGLTGNDFFAAAMMTLDGTGLAGAVILAAGLYQLTPLKRACLDYCRSPADFLSRHHRKGKLGALMMGTHHGIICLGCCWALMSLLFVGGVMNLWWIVGLALIVATEKLSPPSNWLPSMIGIVFAVLGLWLLFSAL